MRPGSQHCWRNYFRIKLWALQLLLFTLLVVSWGFFFLLSPAIPDPLSFQGLIILQFSYIFPLLAPCIIQSVIQLVCSYVRVTLQGQHVMPKSLVVETLLNATNLYPTISLKTKSNSMRYVAAESTQERASLFSHFRHGPRHKVVEWWVHYFHLFFYVFLKCLYLN